MDQYTTAQREALIIERRADRVPYRTIGAELGISGQRVQKIYEAACRKYPVQHLDQHRRDELELTDTAVNELLALARNPQVLAGNRIKAWEAVCRWAERKSRLLGLDAPLRREIEIWDTSTWELEARAGIRQLEAELAANAPEDTL